MSIRTTGDRQPAGQMERGTTLTCKQCGVAFHPRNRNGIVPGCCSRRCKDASRNAQRLKGAALLKEKKPAVRRRRRGLPVFDGRVSQTVLLHLVPKADRPLVLAEAAQRVGLTEGPVLQAARRVRRICDLTIAQGCPSPFCSPDRIALLAEQATDPVKKLTLEAALGVIDTSLASVGLI